MSALGIFDGLWSGVSNSVGQTIGGVTHLVDEKSGAADKQRAEEEKKGCLTWKH